MHAPAAGQRHVQHRRTDASSNALIRNVEEAPTETEHGLMPALEGSALDRFHDVDHAADQAKDPNEPNPPRPEPQKLLGGR